MGKETDSEKIRHSADQIAKLLSRVLCGNYGDPVKEATTIIRNNIQQDKNKLLSLKAEVQAALLNTDNNFQTAIITVVISCFSTVLLFLTDVIQTQMQTDLWKNIAMVLGFPVIIILLVYVLRSLHLTEKNMKKKKLYYYIQYALEEYEREAFPDQNKNN